MTLKARKPTNEEGPSIIYLVAQSYNNILGLEKVENANQADERGKYAAARDGESVEGRHIHTFKPAETTTVGNVIEFMSDNNQSYSVAFNNCQHFVSKFSRRFGNDDDFEKIENGSRGAFTCLRRYDPNFSHETRNDGFGFGIDNNLRNMGERWTVLYRE